MSVQESKCLRVVLDIKVTDLPYNVRESLAEDIECEVNEVPSLATTSAAEAASVLEGLGGEGFNDMLFEGTDVYVKFDYTHVVSAEWVG